MFQVGLVVTSPRLMLYPLLSSQTKWPSAFNVSILRIRQSMAIAVVCELSTVFRSASRHAQYGRAGERAKAKHTAKTLRGTIGSMRNRVGAQSALRN